MRLTLLTETRFEAPAPPFSSFVADQLREDELLSRELLQRGIETVRIDWARPDVRWEDVPVALLRTPWDYFKRWGEFEAFLRKTETTTRLLNTREVLFWNTSKRYLTELGDRGIPSVETQIVDQGTAFDLRRDVCFSGEIVCKPLISGAGRDTFRVAEHDRSKANETLQALLLKESMIVQPYLPAIETEGEVSLVFFGGMYSHAVRKRAAKGEFRIQQDHGGTLHDHVATRDELDVAGAALAAAPSPCTYGRVDLVRDDRGCPRIMELELVEPELWLRREPLAAARFADAIVASLGACC